MSFSEIRDQEVAVRLLRNMIRRDRVAHGLLFHGPPGVGKRLAAVEFAKALNCEKADGDACGICLPCKKVVNGTHPDVKHIEPAGRTRIIDVETIETINDLSAYRPFQGRHRIFIIHDAERMRHDAQNHFLKTLEEPASATLFLLLSEHPQQFLPTIRSRCQQVRFGALRPETVAELLLRDRDLPEEAVRSLARLSQGQMNRAVDLIESERRPIVLNIIDRLGRGEDPLQLSEEFAKHIKAQEEAIKETVKEQYKALAGPEAGTKEEREEAAAEQEATAAGLIRRELTEYLYLFATWYRDELAMSVSANPDLLMNWDVAGQIRASATLEGEKLAAIEKAREYLARNLFRDRVLRDLFFALGR